MVLEGSVLECGGVGLQKICPRMAAMSRLGVVECPFEDGAELDGLLAHALLYGRHDCVSRMY